MTINSFPVQSEGNKPCGLLTVNGLSVPFDEFTVTNNNIYEADEFEATLPLKIQPFSVDVDFWSEVTAVFIEIYLGYPSNALNGQYTTSDLDTIFAGQVDDLTIDEINGCLHISGRDLTAKFVDNTTTEKFQNLTFSQIATLLAERRGLNPIVTPTSTRAGIFYQNNYSQMARAQSEWNILTFLAQQENFLIYVEGLNLIAKPVPTTPQNPFLVQRQAPQGENGYPICNVRNPKFSRSLTIAKDVIVKVRSYTLGSKTAYTVTAKATHNRKTFISGKAQPVGDAEVYSWTIPGLTPEQTRQKAQQLIRQITQHEINFEFDIPGTNLIKKDTIIQVKGFAAGLNQMYYTDRIRRKFDSESGYQMDVHSKNHSPVSVVLV